VFKGKKLVQDNKKKLQESKGLQRAHKKKTNIQQAFLSFLGI
jgi:hypothetical protein